MQGLTRCHNALSNNNLQQIHSSVRLKQHSLQPEYAEKAMKIVINVIPEAFIGNPVSLKDAGNHLDST